MLQAFQRQVQEFLTQLELINKQYRRLARENRTDSSCRLREMVHDGNRRWDNLQKRVAAVIRRLKVAFFEDSEIAIELISFLSLGTGFIENKYPKSEIIKHGCLSVTALHQPEGGV